jgi:hypothetical protein
MKLIKSLFPHIMIILAGIFIVLLILENYNPAMNFIINPVSLALLWVFCILTMVNAGIHIATNRREWKQKNHS